ncbi:MscL family protein [Tropheryma whipplei]|nr:MscL family protein [Tropheryma whipplei]MCO8182898.1 MscL family protein [Tropheryma whipplei]MCO8190610.1 MscL family protein [Tropheryma whipplei]CAD67343.1 large-conductance mechanosensitive channel [Tropheryma whipplei TW08/27]
MFAGFRDFIARRNVVDLSAAVVIGAASTAVINAIVDDIFSPLISAALSSSKIENSLVLTIPTLSHGHVQLKFGTVLLALIKFVLVSAVVYFVIILPLNHLKDIRRTLGNSLPGPLGALSAIISGGKNTKDEDPDKDELADGQSSAETKVGNDGTGSEELSDTRPSGSLEGDTVTKLLMEIRDLLLLMGEMDNKKSKDHSERGL